MNEHKRFKVGSAAAYLRIDEAANLLGIGTENVRSLCGHLKIPLVKLPGQTDYYVLIYALESALFEMGLPVPIRSDPVLARVHQELAGLLYGTLTKEVLKERVQLMATALGKSRGKKKKTPPASWSKWGGREMRRTK